MVSEAYAKAARGVVHDSEWTADDITIAANKGADGSLYQDFGKRFLDFIAAATALIAFALVILGFALAIWFEDGEWPLYSQKRVGRNGRTFGCLKLRTMVADADARLAALLRDDPAAAAEWQATQKLKNDPRITRLGRFLRRTSLDELPQLWNVIRGDMSLVGPRPVVPDELERYGQAASVYLRLRPGATGAWQASGRNEISYDQRVSIDVSYAKHISLLGDIKIMFLTVFALARRTGH
jgi:exopolysaccharide production protein ExoY